MASQNINVGTNADDGTGEPLRNAFIDIRKMFAEVYNQTYTSDTQDLSGATFDLYSKPDLGLLGNVLTLTKPDGTTDTVDLSPYLDEDATAVASATLSGSTITFTRLDSSTFDLDVSTLLGDITSIAAGDGLTGSNLDSGDATLNVVGGDGITANPDEVEVTVDDSTIELSATDGTGAVRIKDDGVTHAKLEGRYTEIQDIATTTGTIILDASSKAAFNLTGALGTATLDIQNIKTGQVIDIILSGSLSGATIDLTASTFTTVAINKVGSTSLDTAATNILQVLCVDDTDADAILTWAVASYATGTTV